MVHRRYYSPFENDVIVEPRRIEHTMRQQEPQHREEHRSDRIDKAPALRKLRCRQFPHTAEPLTGFMAGVQLDDILIIGIILLLLFEEQSERDVPLIIGLGALLLFGFLDT